MYTQNQKYMYKNNKIIRRYSESFKLKILSELSKGKNNKRQTVEKFSTKKSLMNTNYLSLLKSHIEKIYE